MKIKDYWRLAKVSLAARKKTTRATVRGMAFGLIVLVPLLFGLIGLNQSVLGELNKNPEQLYATFYSAEPGNNIEELPRYGDKSWSGQGAMNTAYSDHNDYFANSELDTLHYTMHTKTISLERERRRRFYEKIIIDGKSYELKATDDMFEQGRDNVQFDQYASIVRDDIAKANEIIAPQLVENMDKGFRGDGAQQVIISEKYLKYAGLQPSDVYGKKITVYLRDEAYSYPIMSQDNNTGDMQYVNAISKHLFKDFEVVGVIKDKIFEKMDIRNSAFVFTGSSCLDKNGKIVLAPTLDVDGNAGVSDAYIWNYGDYIKMDQLTDKYVFFGASAYRARQIYDQYDRENEGERIMASLEPHVYMYLAKDYKDLQNAVNMVYPEYKRIYEKEDDMISEMSSSTFSSFQFLNKIFVNISLVAGVIAGVILFAALINLFNSVKHSVDSRRNYLGVMRAIGAKNNDIPKLYFFEVMRIFLRAYIRILIIGTIICIGIIILFFYASKYMPFPFLISWVNIPIVMGLLLVMLVIIGVIYSLVCSFAMSRKPITELLED